jgi:hypothetical protein
VNGAVESADSSSVSAPLQFSAAVMSGSAVVLSGCGGSPGQTYYVLASTNLSLALSLWLRIATNTFGAGGWFSFTSSAVASLPQQFYRIQVP